MIILPAIAAPAVLDLFTADLVVSYHLYVNAYSPDETTTLSDFVEASWPGYSAQTAKGWTPALWQPHYAISSADPLVWELSSAIPLTLVWGYYVTDLASDKLLWCQAVLKGSVSMQNPGDAVRLLPELRACEGCGPM